MLGAIIGDIVGSRFEYENNKSKDFELFGSGCYATDDTIITLAIAKAVIECNGAWSLLGLNARDAIRTCKECGKCGLSITKVFGKEYDYACEKSIVFTNPDIKSIDCIIKLIELRKKDIKEGKAKKHKYIPMRDR